MNLKIKREGGFIPMEIEKEMDLKDLPADLQSIIKTYTQKVDDVKIKLNPKLSDGFKYTLEWSGEKTGMVQFDDSTIPNSLKKVISFILK